MKKALPTVLLMCTILSITTASANDGTGRNSTTPPTNGRPVATDVQSRNERNWLSEFWEDFMDMFRSKHHHYTPSAPGSPTHAPGAGGGAAAPGGSSTPGGTPAPGSNSAPIDGGILFLLAAGLGLGMIRVYGSYKVARQPQE